MKYATRLNSFLKRKGQSMESALAKLGAIEGLGWVDLNYPEHFAGHTAEELSLLIKKNHLKLNGLSIRFEDVLADGEFTNHSFQLAQIALDTCIDAVRTCRQMGGSVVTVWQAFDGYDYPFQMDYVAAWDKMAKAIAQIAEEAAPDINISIEYKPYQPRSFSMVPNMATALLMIEDIGRANVGLTLDFCHMLMAGENPGTALALTASRGRLFGIHLNDGYRLNDDGLMVGSVHPLQTLEFLYYALVSNYQHAVFFDTFPVREDPSEECSQNIQTVNRLVSALGRIGLDKIAKMVQSQSGMTGMEIFHLVLK
jgi:xylose isomerase